MFMIIINIVYVYESQYDDNITTIRYSHSDH